MRVFIPSFITVVLTLLELLATLFMFLGVTVPVWGKRLGHGDAVFGLGPFTVFYEGFNISCFWIEIL